MGIIAAVLAGGESRRMGRDKAQIVVSGETLLTRTVRLAMEVFPSVMVVGRTQSADSPLPNVPFWPDDLVGQGPLGGLVTALSQTEGTPVMLIPCDLPRLTVNALRWIFTAVGEHAPLTHGLVTVNGGQWEPLFSVYTAACIPLIETHLAQGRRSLRALINVGQFSFLDIPLDVAASLRDVDTPEDLNALN